MKKIFSSICILVIIMASCKKVTDQTNPSGLTSENFYKTATDADNAINAVYDAFQSPYQYTIWGDALTDIFDVTDRSSTTEIQLVNGNLSSENGLANWNNMYTAIKLANSVLKNVPGISDPALTARKERIIGEAYFLRAIAYFYLVRTFENVPLLTEPYESLKQDFYPKQANPSDVFAQIGRDLKEAEKRLTDVPYATLVENKGKATLGAVRATLADYYLWQKKYREAADAAQLVISSSAGYSLVSGDNFLSIFTTRNTSESIYEIQFNYQTYLEGNTNDFALQFLPIGGTNYVGGGWYLKPSAKLVALFEAGDKRATATFRNTGTSPAPFRDPNQLYINKYQGTLAAGNTTRYGDNNAVIYRLADVLLMKAEALNELGQSSDAAIILNQVRARAGIAATSASRQSDLRLAIENERFVELAFEGKRYFDLKRTGRYTTVTGHAEPKYLRWPIINTELVLNKNLVQNTGY